MPRRRFDARILLLELQQSGCGGEKARSHESRECRHRATSWQPGPAHRQSRGSAAAPRPAERRQKHSRDGERPRQHFLGSHRIRRSFSLVAPGLSPQDLQLHVRESIPPTSVRARSRGSYMVAWIARLSYRVAVMPATSAVELEPPPEMGGPITRVRSPRGPGSGMAHPPFGAAARSPGLPAGLMLHAGYLNGLER